MNAEIITIGDEILIGQTIDTNSAWLGKELNAVGIAIKQITSIKDTREDILESLRLAFQRADLILITGGLGPTQDDITKDVLCEYFETELEINQEVLNKIQTFFKERGREILEVNNLQASLPKACTVLPNELGTASGMWFEKEGKVFVSMPGVPYEMKGLMSSEVLPKLKEQFELPSIIHRTIMTEGIGESFLVEIIKEWEESLDAENIKVAYLPSPGIVRIRLSLFGNNYSEMESKVNRKINELNRLIPTFIFAESDVLFEKSIGDLLIQSGKTISTAESCTGGNIAHLLTSISGSSNYFLGSIVSYSNEIKVQELSVLESDLDEFGAVSQAVVEQMAKGVRAKMKTDFALATSGIAGPDGGSEEKPVGIVWIAIAYEGGVYSKKFMFEQNRSRNIKRASYAALSLLKRKILNQLD
jgi:nicotinamide-nucleotide amidase